MKIRIFKSDDEWRAEPTDLPGDPPTGLGRNPHEAVGSLMFAIQSEPTWQGHGWPAILIEYVDDPSPQDTVP